MPLLFEDDFRTFLRNGRKNLDDFCVIWCNAYFVDESLHYFYCRQFTKPEGHAETLLLEQLENIEEQYNDKFSLRLRQAPVLVRSQKLSNVERLRYLDGVITSEVIMYCSYSPCSDCAQQLIHFANQRPNMTLRIISSALYYHTIPCHQQGLINLHCTPNIDLHVFKSHDWNYLNSLRFRRCRHKNNGRETLRYRCAWDDIWEEQLNAIMQGNQVMSFDMMQEEVENMRACNY